MDSKIQIDLDGSDNQPVITVTHKESEDVRDKMVKVFTETFGADSSWARISVISGGKIQIRPIKPSELREEIKIIGLKAK